MVMHGKVGRVHHEMELLALKYSTEEVFTTPHADRVNGTVRASKPLVHRGTLIDGIEVRFEEGKIVEAKADIGEEVFLQLIDTDEGARKLGEDLS